MLAEGKEDGEQEIERQAEWIKRCRRALVIDGSTRGNLDALCLLMAS